MKLLNPISFFRTVRHRFLFFVISVFLAVALTISGSNSSLSDGVVIFIIGSLLLVFILWEQYFDYKKRVRIFKESGLVSYLLSIEFEIKESFDKWNFKLIAEGQFEGYPVQIDMVSTKGWIGQDYRFVTMAFISNETVKQGVRKVLLKEKISICDGYAQHFKEIPLSHDIVILKKLESVLLDLTNKLKENNIHPLSIA